MNDTVEPSPSQAAPAAQVPTLLREHPGLVVTLTYLVLSAIGVLYNAWLFLNFRINILYYSEPADFVMAALRDPIVILLCILPYPLVRGLDILGERAKARFKGYGRLSNSMERGLEKRKIGKRTMTVIAVLVWSFAFTANYANYVAKTIREGLGNRVEIHLSQDAPPLPSPLGKPILIGTTNRFVFLHYPEQKVTHIVPMGMVSRLVIVRRSRKDEAAPALPPAPLPRAEQNATP